MNSKQRKLKYIRQKNSLRNGGLFESEIKISTEISNFERSLAYNEMIKQEIINKSKKYKMQLFLNIFEHGLESKCLCGDGFKVYSLLIQKKKTNKQL